MCVGGITNHNQLFEEILDIRMNFSLEYVHNLNNSIPRRIISEPRDLLRSIKGRFFMVFIINTRFFLHKARQPLLNGSQLGTSLYHMIAATIFQLNCKHAFIHLRIEAN